MPPIRTRDYDTHLSRRVTHLVSMLVQIGIAVSVTALCMHMTFLVVNRPVVPIPERSPVRVFPRRGIYRSINADQTELLLSTASFHVGLARAISSARSMDSWNEVIAKLPSESVMTACDSCLKTTFYA